MLSAGICSEGAAWQCGIVPWDLWPGFNKWTFIPFVFPWVGWYASTQTPGVCLGTPAFRLLFGRMSNISGHFFLLLIGTVLAVSHRWNVVLGNSWGGGLAMGVPVSSCDLWQRTFHSWICPSTAPSATQHGMEQCGKNLERVEEGIVCQPGLRRGGRIFQSYKNMPKKIYHWMTDGLSGIPSSNPDVVLSLSGSWTETHTRLPLSYLLNGD